MNLEQRLRAALRARAERVEPDAAGAWAEVEQRAAAARRARDRRRAAGVLVAAAALVAAVVAAPALFDDDDTVEVGVADSTTTTEAPTTTTTTATTAPSTTIFPADEPWPGIWPFTSPSAVADYAEDPGAGQFLDPESTAAEFARAYLGMPDPVTGAYQPGGPNDGEVPVVPRPGSPMTTTVSVRSFVSGDTVVWVVTGAHSSNIVLDDPDPMTAIDRPVRVAGRASAYEGTVLVEAREDGMELGQRLGHGFVTGSGSSELGPFEGEISYETPSRDAGALVLFTESAEDGSVMQATVVRVWFVAPGT